MVEVLKHASNMLKLAMNMSHKIKNILKFTVLAWKSLVLSLLLYLKKKKKKNPDSVSWIL